MSNVMRRVVARALAPVDQAAKFLRQESPPLSDIDVEEGRTTQFVRFWLQQRPDLDSDSLALQLTIARIGLLSRGTLRSLAEADVTKLCRSGA